MSGFDPKQTLNVFQAPLQSLLCLVQASGQAMRRRDFIKTIGGAAAVWPLAARAQEPQKIFRIGFLGVSRDAPGTAALYQAFSDQLRENGFSEGQNLVIKYARSDDPRGVAFARKELLDARLDLIVAQGPETALRAVIDASRPIPIVVQAINYDPIGRGYVASLARPGGNITGLFYQQAELTAKKVELLRQVVPERTSLGVLWDAPVSEEFEAAERAAKALKLELHALKLENPPYDFTAAFQIIAQAGAQMLLVLSSPLFAQYRRVIAKLAIEHRLPAMFIFKSYVQAGGLMSYGVDQIATYRRTADFVAKILKGAKPADLPIEQPTKFELAINLKTAKALGITVPQSMLVAAYAVIE
jgi:putative ABC transport system substrate-binding protein